LRIQKQEIEFAVTHLAQELREICGRALFGAQDKEAAEQLLGGMSQ
jgi:hypothetical protein